MSDDAISIIDQWGDVTREIDTLVCVDTNGWIQYLDIVLSLIDESKPYVVYAPFEVIQNLNALRQSGQGVADARVARRAFRKILQLVREKSRNLQIQTQLDENTVSALYPNQDKIISACLVLKSKGITLSLLTLDQERISGAYAAAIDLFDHKDIETLPMTVPISAPNADDDAQLRQRIQQEWLELNFNDDTTENLTEDLIKKGLEIGLVYAKAPPKKRKLIDRLLCSDVQNIIPDIDVNEPVK